MTHLCICIYNRDMLLLLDGDVQLSVYEIYIEKANMHYYKPQSVSDWPQSSNISDWISLSPSPEADA